MTNSILVGLASIGGAVLLALLVFAGKKIVSMIQEQGNMTEEEIRNEIKDIKENRTFSYLKFNQLLTGEVTGLRITSVTVKRQQYDSVEKAWDHMSKKQQRIIEELERYLAELRLSGKMYDVIQNPYFGDKKDNNKIYLYDLGLGAISDRCDIEIVTDPEFGLYHVNKIFINEEDYSYQINALDEKEWAQFKEVMGQGEYKKEYESIERIKNRLDHFNGLVFSKDMTIDDQGRVSFRVPTDSATPTKKEGEKKSAI